MLALSASSALILIMGNDTINKHNQQKQLKTLICGHCWRLQCNETTAISRIFMQFMHVHCCFAKPSAEAGHLIISKQTTFLDPIFIVCRHYYVHKFKLSLKILRQELFSFCFYTCAPLSREIIGPLRKIKIRFLRKCAVLWLYPI